jgi:hypothetical protein
VVCECGIVDKGDGKPAKRLESIIPSYRTRGSESGYFDQARRQELLHEMLEQRAQGGREAWRELHCYLGNDLNWLAGIWEPQIPKFGCSCEEFYREIKRLYPPDYSTPESAFAWGVRLHNRINEKLGKPEFTVQQAMERWRPHLAWATDQPTIENCVAVTSMSPLANHVDVQRECLASWRRMGLFVVSGNLSSEVSEIDALYPDVPVQTVESSAWYDRPTPRIRDLLQLGGDDAVLLINSDIALHGSQSILTDAIRVRQPMAFIRYNWAGHPGRGERERWGLDAFLLFPEQIATLPDLDFAVGQPMWDYWIPYHLQRAGVELQWWGEPFAFHRTHPVHWKPESVSIGQRMLQEHYETDVAWEQWRKSLPFGG